MISISALEAEQLQVGAAESQRRAPVRRVNEIPIIMPVAYGGLGDIMTTLKLRSGLQREFPDKKVRIYFAQEEDYKKAFRLGSSSGISEVNDDNLKFSLWSSLREKSNEYAISVVSPIAVAPQPPLEDFITYSDLNLYLEEYDCREKIRLPRGLRVDKLFVDQGGRRHLVLPTGFDENSPGVHIDSGLVREAGSRKIKREVLENSDLDWLTHEVPDIYQSEWALAYYREEYHFRTEGNSSYLKALIKALGETGNCGRRVTIFDFGESDPINRGKRCRREPFHDLYIDGSRHVQKISGDPMSWTDAPISNIYIVHLGYRAHSTFLDFLRASDLPVAITGDASLSEAISLSRPFVYLPPSWKSHVFPNLIRQTPDLLDDWRDIDRIRSLWGCDEVDESRLVSYPKLEAFYLRFRQELHTAFRLEDERRRADDYHTTAERILEDMVRKNQIQMPPDDQLQFNRNRYAFWSAYYARSQGLQDELKNLRLRYIFGTDTGIMGKEKTSRLFYDPQYSASFKKLNSSIVDRRNLARNLAAFIREALLR